MLLGFTEKVHPHVTEYLHLPDVMIGPAFRALYPKRGIHYPKGFDPSGYFYWKKNGISFERQNQARIQ